MVIAADLPSELSDGEVHRLVFETFGQPRFTQDSPFMPEVWTAFISLEEQRARERVLGKQAPSDLVDLLITPWRSVPTGEVAQKLTDCARRCFDNYVGYTQPALQGDPRTAEVSRLMAGAEIAPGWTHVVAQFNFEVAAQAILPLTDWWIGLPKRTRTPSGVGRLLSNASAVSANLPKLVETGGGWEQLRFVALAGFVMHLRTVSSLDDLRGVKLLLERLSEPLLGNEGIIAGNTLNAFNVVVAAYKDLLADVVDAAEQKAAASSKPKPFVFSVNTNRSARPAIFDSRGTIKADAAQNLFSIETDGIFWAVIDGGIDATHPAFRDLAISNPPEPPPPDPSPLPSGHSRIVKTYDFTNLRRLLATGKLEPNPRGWPTQNDVQRMMQEPGVVDALARLSLRTQSSRDLDWALLDPLISIPHDGGYARPKGDHGTHVAGILCANWPAKESHLAENFVGMCPKLRLYDLRVFDDRGESDEFAIMSALSFVGWLNRDRANPAIHGVNLSLALTHNVDAFACGRTPVCDVCNELVGSGTVVVAAAGNTGFEAQAEKRSRGTGYRSISITDPGNAEQVITVGSVHKSHPHAYGVSYFSGRGPTGDGRRKPDLVAPGEKIESTVADKGTRRLDGTSMAAPHVSGAAVLLMARHRELVGSPRRVKEILMKTATDLGRENYFQGAGLVDVLRALQSV
jgi:subtilisin family serine protease